MSQLNSYVTFKNGKKRPKKRGGFPVFGGNGVLAYTDTYNAEECIVIGRVGAYCGSVYLSEGKCWISDNAIVAIPNKKSDLKYIYYLLGTLQLNKRSIGTSQPLLTQEILNRIEVEIPSLKKQSKVVSVLSGLDKKIALNNEVNNNLEQQAQAIFKSWFIDNTEESWQSGTFSDLIQNMIAGDWGKDKPNGNNTEQVYCIRGADIPEVKAGNKGKMPTRYILPKNHMNKHLVDGDLVVEISGGSPTQSTGRIAAVSQALLNRYDSDMVCTNFCKAMKPLAGYSMYVYYYWQYLYDKGVFFSYENGTTGIKNLDISGFLETEPIVIGPAELVGKFDEYCHSIAQTIFDNGLENERLAEIRDTLLPRLMSGEIDVSDIDL